MTNSEMLKRKIKESGYKVQFIAQRIGLSYQGFLNKIQNQSEFKASEIQTLCELLNLSVPEREEIFFCADCR